MTTRPARQVWEAALGELQVQVSKPNYRTWFEKSLGLSYQGNQFVVGVPNTFVAEYLDRNQRSLIEKTLIGITGRDVNVVFHVDTNHRDSFNSGDVRGKPSLADTLRLNSKYTFDSFIVGDCNRFAHNAALEVVQNPGHSYNPLFICGGVGLGKTHLLHAIAHLALANNIKVLYVSAEQFTNEFIIAVRDRKTEEFRNKYRTVNLLLIDDIHFISGKAQTQESFFHTFNELHNSNHQIAVTSDCPPKSLPLLEDRLRSRLEWGLVVNIQPPDFQTRLDIVQAKSRQQGIQIPLKTMELIAQRGQRNIRELEGYINRVAAFAKLTKALPTPELALQALQDIASKVPQNAAITPTMVIEVVAQSFQLTLENIKSRRRKATTLARQVAMYLIRQETNCSLAQIGQELGGREPITVSSACKTIADNVNSDPGLRQRILNIQQKLYAK